MGAVISTGTKASVILSKGAKKYQDSINNMQALAGYGEKPTPEQVLGLMSASAGFIGLFKSNTAGEGDGTTFSIHIENKSTGIIVPQANMRHGQDDISVATFGCALLAPGESTKIDFHGPITKYIDPFVGAAFDLFDDKMNFVTTFMVDFGSDENKSNFIVREVYSNSDRHSNFNDPDTIGTVYCAVLESKFAAAITGAEMTSSASAVVGNIVVVDYVA